MKFARWTHYWMPLSPNDGSAIDVVRMYMMMSASDAREQLNRKHTVALLTPVAKREPGEAVPAGGSAVKREGLKQASRTAC